jgi:hypothetical protein
MPASRERPWPVCFLVCISLGCAGLSIWPVLVAGKSFVSPNFGTRLLYEEFPTLPGSRDARVAEVHGSDIGAMDWQCVPYGAIAGRALFHDHTLPLWNRYAATGTPLLGQGQSMALDPLQWPVMASGSAAWAWDVKFAVAKWLFALGIGLIVLQATGHRFAAGLLAAAAPFTGFFQYRINHPAFFSVCYAPWIIAAAFAAARSRSRRGWVLALTGWFLADWMELNSGTVKEAACILLLLNLLGLALVAGLAAPGRPRLRRSFGVGLLFAALAGITCPLWSSLWVSLRSAYLSSAGPPERLPWGLLLGYFDEGFFRPFVPGDGVYDPALNFVFLGGVLYFLATLRIRWREPVGRATTLVCAGAGAVIFGVVPAAWIRAVPLFGHLSDYDSALGCACLVPIALLAGMGIAAAANRLRTPDGARDLAWGTLLLLMAAALYLRLTQADPRQVGAALRFGAVSSGKSTSVPPALAAYFALLLASLPLLGIAARWALLRPKWKWLCLAVSAAILAGYCWQGLPRLEDRPAGTLSSFRVEFPARADFSASSPAVQFIQERLAREPARVAGLGINLFPGWSGYYGLENISGPDALMNRDFRNLTAAMGLDRRMDWMLCLELPLDAARRRDFDFLGLRYFVGGPRQGEPAGFPAIAHLDLTVFERPSAWPRAFFASGIEHIDALSEFVRRVDSGDGLPFAAVDSSVLTEEPRLAGLLNGPAAVSPASDYLLTNHATAFTIVAPRPGLAVLGEMNWPGYPHATVDGAVARTFRVNRIGIAAYIAKPGRHRVVVDFRPPRFLLSEEVAALSLGLAAAALLWSMRRSRESQEI